MRLGVMVCCSMLAVCVTASAQSVREVPPLQFSEPYLRAVAQFDAIAAQDATKALEWLDRLMPSITSPYERFSLYQSFVVPAHVRAKAFGKVLEVLLRGHREGLFFPLTPRDARWLDEFTKVPGASEVLAENERLREQAQRSAVPEYIVRTPAGFDRARKHPLLMVLHGGWGSHYQLSRSWTSRMLNEEFIVAFVQGEVCRASYLRSYTPGDMESIVAVYRDVVQKYPVDLSRVFVGGPSAAGGRSLNLALDARVAPAGLFLMFPALTAAPGDAVIAELASRKVRLVLLTGEQDPGVVAQKSFAVKCDQAKIPNRFLIFSEKGHEYPDGFPHQIDLSLSFLLGRSK